MPDLRQSIEEALAGGVEYVLAHVEDGRIGAAVPAKVRTAAEAARAVFDRRCRHNLVALLPKGVKDSPGTAARRKIGLVVKACDLRSLVVLLQEEMVERASLHLIGVVCPGVDEDGAPAPRCVSCRDRVPAFADVLVGEATQRAPGADEFAEVAAFEAKSPAERWAYWSAEFARCRRCYACRQACPLCYCEECLADRSYPQLVEVSVKPSANLAFHLMRAYHLAGRCADCGACQSACPEHLPLRLLGRKMAREVKTMFGHEAGVDPAAKPPLVTLFHDDPDSILKGGMNGE